MAKVWIVEDDEMMAECLVRAVNVELRKDVGLRNERKVVHPEHQVKTFPNAIAAINFLNDEIPEVVLLDILLTGPDGFTFLNELISYHDTVNIPVIIVTSLDLSTENLQQYNIVEVLQKETMTPREIKFAVERALKNAK